MCHGCKKAGLSYDQSVEVHRRMTRSMSLDDIADAVREAHELHTRPTHRFSADEMAELAAALEAEARRSQRGRGP